MQICLQVQKLLINQSGYRREFHSEKFGWENFVSHTTVLHQLQFKMPEAVIKHHIWPLKIMFSNRKMPEAPDFDEKRKSVFLTCRSKIVALCIVTEYQCDSFWAVGSKMSDSVRCTSMYLAEENDFFGLTISLKNTEHVWKLCQSVSEFPKLTKAVIPF